MTRTPTPLALLAGLLAASAQAQTPTPAPAPPPVAVEAAPPAPAEGAAQRIEITGGRATDNEERRRATAAKIVIGREQIEQYGDSNLGEVLRRLPGVTTPGAPGRGGPPRMRGLGSGYTQLLIDGEPLPRGFSLESLTPEQVERIEILRAPTAETGARAIAGTINIILREGMRKRLNDLRMGVGIADGAVSPGMFWTHNDSVDQLTYNLSGSLFRRHNESRSQTETRSEDALSGDELALRREVREGEEKRVGANLTARLQWRLPGQGDQLMLTPSVFHTENEGQSVTRLLQDSGVSLYDLADGRSQNRFTVARLNGQWRQRLSPALRAEVSGTAGGWQAHNSSQRDESIAGVKVRRLDDVATTSENNLTLKGKLSFTLGEADAQGGGEHSLVSGLELEANRRQEDRDLRQNGLPLLTDFGDQLQASSTRLALFAQNEWHPTAQWSAHAGLRWEGIDTTGDLGDGSRPRNQSSVWTPLAHAVWKPDPKSRSQLRMSLTRSYRAPTLGSLIARPTPNSRFPVDGANEPTHPDRAGNPKLVAELASGVDLAIEHYPAGGGVLSASLFRRNISNLMRTVTTLETVSWSPVPRWVARTRNVGDAVTQGIELEAKGRLDLWLKDAPRVDLNANLSLFNSRVDGVPGPDNRLDQQAKGTLNLGADYKIPALPLKLGGNLNLVPGYRTQVSEDQVVGVSSRRIVDVYGLWTFNPALAMRVSASNLAPRDSDDYSRLTSAGVAETTRTLSASDINWQLRLELKL